MVRQEGEPVEASPSTEPLVTRLGFGAMMRAAREDAGYSIERVAMATRISPPFIEALENEQFDKLPGAIFGRGFVRNLCKAYGKNSLEFLEALERKIYQNSQGHDLHDVSRDEKRHHQLKKGVLLIQPKEWRRHLKAWAPHHYLRAKPLAMIAGVLLAAVIAAKLVSDQMTPSSPSDRLSSEASGPETPTAQAARVQAVEAVPSTPAAAPVAAPAVAEVASTALPNGALEVELRVKEPVTVTLTKDQDKQVSEQLQVQTYRYQFVKQLKLNVENAAAVEIYFKGQRIGASAQKGEPKRYTFAAADSEIAKKPSPSPL